MRSGRRATRSLLVVLVWMAVFAAGAERARHLREAAVTDPLHFFPPQSSTRRAAAAVGELFPGARAASQIVVVLEARETPIEGQLDRIGALASRLRSSLPA